MFLNRKIILI
jgi:hypothetical protein